MSESIIALLGWWNSIAIFNLQTYFVLDRQYKNTYTLGMVGTYPLKVIISCRAAHDPLPNRGIMR